VERATSNIVAPLSSDAFARLFEAVHEGVYIGLIGAAAGSSVTLAANPHLRLMFGWATTCRPPT